jgi:hypothetical protein
MSNKDYFNFNYDSNQKFYKKKLKKPLEVDELPNFEKVNVQLQKQITKPKNNNYYNLYKDFDETKSKDDIIKKLEKAPFTFLNEHPQKYYQRYNNIKQCEDAKCEDADNADLVREAYFLRENIEIIQNAIIRNIAKKTNCIISRQKEEDLLILMFGVFNDYGRNLPYNLKEQLQELNDRTVNFVTPYLISEIESYKNYLIDCNTPLRPPELPIAVAKIRKESLPSVLPR